MREEIKKREERFSSSLIFCTLTLSFFVWRLSGQRGMWKAKRDVEEGKSYVTNIMRDMTNHKWQPVRVERRTNHMARLVRRQLCIAVASCFYYALLGQKAAAVS